MSTNDNFEAFHQELSKVFSAHQLKSDDLYREVYARDASYFSILPKLIVRPDNIEQMTRLFALLTKYDQHVTFRAGGTSLAGQTVGDGVICELRTAWRNFEVRENGNKIWFEPGLTCRQLNQMLHAYKTKLGPDPASHRAAMMGGVLANNSSGMQAGTQYNSYRLLTSMEFIMANGNKYNSALESDRKRFETEERNLCAGLMQIRNEILTSSDLRERILRKYEIKNVTGYGMNSFIDFDNPMDIFTHLLIGSEGTLAFIASAEQKTVPLLPYYSSAMLYFSDVTRAAAAVPMLGETGALAIEMMDYASLQSMKNTPKSLPVLSTLPQNSTALLIDFGASTQEELDDKIRTYLPEIKSLSGINTMDNFTRTIADREKLWNIRDGIFPCVAGARALGDAVILEDVAAPVDRLDKLVDGVSSLFSKYDYKGSIFGHARDGDIHPLITSDMADPKEKAKFGHFMDDLVTLVLSLDGALKGEHGTGRAVAPYVEQEWGEEIYMMMKRVKQLADPQNRLNPGVLINDNPEAHLEHVKEMTPIGDHKADKCIECGFCEHVCPSRYTTLTPRQRIQSRRIIAGNKNTPLAVQLEKDYKYAGRDTCAADGMCKTVCPMGINTAELTDDLRAGSLSAVEQKLFTSAAKNFRTVEKGLKASLRLAVGTQNIVTAKPLKVITSLGHKFLDQMPHWSENFPSPPLFRAQVAEEPEFIYFPSCVTRIFGSSNDGKDDMMQVVLRIGKRAGLKIELPEDVQGLCCSQIWEHKGDPEGQRIVANRLIDHFWRWSRAGKLPVLCDTTSCTHTMLKELVKEEHADILNAENKERYAKLQIIDITTWIHDTVMPRLEVKRKKGKVLLHPTCACDIMGYTPLLEAIARQCADEVILPKNWGCCGASGDRGFVFPELSQSATRDEKRELQGQSFDGCYSLARTCEINMRDHMDFPYESIVYLVDETTE